MENPIFPIALNKHLIFCAISVVFFLFQFVRMKNKYQLVLAIAIPASLLVYVSENKTWFSFVGILEFAMLVLAFVLYIFDRRRAKQAEAAAAAAVPADAVPAPVETEHTAEASPAPGETDEAQE